MAKIKTNKIVYTLSREKLFENYDIFTVTTDEPYFEHGARMLDDPLMEKRVCSVLFDYGRRFFVLMKKDTGNRERLLSVLKDIKGGNKISVLDWTESPLKDCDVLQLLLNSLSYSESKFFGCNNLTGHFYCFNTNWFKTTNKTGKKKRIPCLELKITNDYRMRIDVRTFTNIEDRRYMKFSPKKPFESYAQYVFGNNHALRRKTDNDSCDDSYILKETVKHKSEIPFLLLADEESFDKSKMGVLASIVELFNEKFKDIACIDFEYIEECDSLEYKSAERRQSRKNIEEQFSKLPVKIIDAVNEDDSVDKCRQLQSALEEKYGIKSKMSKRIVKDAYNIRLIHNADYYEERGLEDPHLDLENTALQHITYEDFKLKNALDVVVSEVIIKNDLVNKKISLYDWASLGFDEDIEFGIKSGFEYPRYFFMTVHPDGTFEFVEQELNLLESGRYDQCVQIFEEDRKKNQVHGVIRDKKGNINVIKDTGWFTIPEIFEIKKELSGGNSELRGKEKRDELLFPVVDIKTFVTDGDRYYFVGTIGEGMQSSVQRASLIRRIERFENSESLFEKLLPLMNVSFVRNKQLTITPFPFKYLREYVKGIK